MAWTTWQINAYHVRNFKYKTWHSPIIFLSEMSIPYIYIYIYIYINFYEQTDVMRLTCYIRRPLFMARNC